MRGREVGWGLYLAGLPFAHFVLWPSQLTPWQAQTFWGVGGLAILLGVSLAQPGRVVCANRPLGWWVGWVGLSVIWIWSAVIRTDRQHPIGLLLPLMHTLCLPLFYVAATRQWSADLLARLVRWVAISGVVVVAYGVLQVLQLDQFYRSVDRAEMRDSVLGTMGNPTHYGIHVALLLPIFLWQPGWWWKLVAGVGGSLLFATRSSSAVVAGLVVGVWWVWCERRLFIIPLLTVLAVVGGVLLWRFPDWLNPHGRWEAWHALWQHYLVGQQKLQVTGAGLGSVMEQSLRNPLGWPFQWRHAHNEFFQVLIEQGVVGFGLVLWGVGHAIHRWRRLSVMPVRNMIAGMGMVFVVTSLLNFPAHLWVLASLGLVAYCGVYALASEGSG